MLLLGRLLHPLHNNGRLGSRDLIFTQLFAPIIVDFRAHPYVDGKALAGVPLVDPAHRRNVAVIAAVRDPHVPQADRLS